MHDYSAHSTSIHVHSRPNNLNERDMQRVLEVVCMCIYVCEELRHT